MGASMLGRLCRAGAAPAATAVVCGTMLLAASQAPVPTGQTFHGGTELLVTADGNDEMQMQGYQDRSKYREIVGTKYARELILK